MRTYEDASLGMLLTHTYYYLAQVHGRLDNAKKSAEFCHTTLSRQVPNIFVHIYQIFLFQAAEVRGVRPHRLGR